MCTECIIIGGLIHPMKGDADSRIWELLNVESGFEITDKPQTRRVRMKRVMLFK